ncbi:hypothetical protein HB662_23840 [Roseomonas frigidaquae]|uniref:Uncharacterized protein n=1 Tax=Falsiroseomonas frigidaquae TaxID=487318 RepID=A0ABX1F637_9PROT|nr:hypothetical protein [Falsiroseomonas frigidaquae]NKE47829.1 hypothetical protein [Falsiroseomonas frigidaquae]
MRRATLALALLAAPAAAQAPGWEARVVEYAPALRACLATKPEAMVLEAWPAARGMTLARLLLPDGTREDCLAHPNGMLVEGRRAVPEEERRPGEGLRAFMLQRRCVDAWRVVDGEGKELGWLAYPGCG